MWLLACRAQAQNLWHMSLAVACEIFPEQESNPFLLQWQADSLPLSYQGSPVPQSLCISPNRTTKFFLNRHYPLLQEALQANLTGPSFACSPHPSCEPWAPQQQGTCNSLMCFLTGHSKHLPTRLRMDPWSLSSNWSLFPL